MRHRKKKHLRGDKDRRRKELRALVTALFLYEKIETTAARARILKAAAERMVTRGKKLDLPARRQLLRNLPANAVKKIFEVYVPRFQTRPGGYCRITHVGKFRDGTAKVLVEFV